MSLDVRHFGKDFFFVLKGFLNQILMMMIPFDCFCWTANSRQRQSFPSSNYSTLLYPAVCEEGHFIFSATVYFFFKSFFYILKMIFFIK